MTITVHLLDFSSPLPTIKLVMRQKAKQTLDRVDPTVIWGLQACLISTQKEVRSARCATQKGNLD